MEPMLTKMSQLVNPVININLCIFAAVDHNLTAAEKKMYQILIC